MSDYIAHEIAAAEASTSRASAFDDLTSAYPKVHEHFVRYRVDAGNPFPISPVRSSLPMYIRHRFEWMRQFFSGLKERIENTEFDLYLGDGFSGWSLPMARPVFCFSKHRTRDPSALLLPDPMSLKDAEMLQLKVEEGNARFPWPSKRNTGFWRGGTTGTNYSTEAPFHNHRLKLVDLASQRPDLVDAKFTGFHPSCGPPVRQLIKARDWFGDIVDITAHMQFKYLLMVDGFTSPWPRFYWGMFSNSAIFKQNSELVGWFDAGVVPRTHFVPLANDLSDLYDMIRWARHNDERVHVVSQQAREFAANNLSRTQMEAYTAKILNSYTVAFGD